MAPPVVMMFVMDVERRCWMKGRARRLRARLCVARWIEARVAGAIDVERGVIGVEWLPRRIPGDI